jgi:hypothetical protein
MILAGEILVLCATPVTVFLVHISRGELFGIEPCPALLETDKAYHKGTSVFQRRFSGKKRAGLRYKGDKEWEEG